MAAGCDSGATGIDGCRSIEQARCRAVVGCPGSPIETAEQVSNCELFYADHCLHGMADQLDPDQGSVEACVNAIALARACADAGQTLGTCVAVAADAGTAAPSMITGTSPDTTGCQAVQNPEILQACNFLAAAPTPAGTAGAGGAGGSSAQGGTGG